jgi:hypothetical protein
MKRGNQSRDQPRTGVESRRDGVSCWSTAGFVTFGIRLATQSSLTLPSHDLPLTGNRRTHMHTDDYIGEKTGLFLVDPYNDFLSPAGKLPIEINLKRQKFYAAARFSLL